MMKKTLVLTLILSMILAAFAGLAGAAEQEITVVIDGRTQTYTQAPVIKNGTTLVPLRGIFEALGATVTYDSATKKIVGKKADIEVVLVLGQKKATVNGKTVELAQAAQVMNGSTMVPLRFIGQSLGADVEWEGATKTIWIYSFKINEADLDAILTLLDKVIETSNNEDVDGYVALFDPNIQGLDQVKEQVKKNFETFDLDFSFESYVVLDMKADYAVLELVQVTTSKTPNPQFRDNAIVIHQSFVKVNGEWKLSAASIEDIEYLK